MLRQEPPRVAVLESPGAPVALQCNSDVVRFDGHAEFASEVTENLAGGDALGMRLYGPQGRLAERCGVHRLAGPLATFGSGCRRLFLRLLRMFGRARIITDRDLDRATHRVEGGG